MPYIIKHLSGTTAEWAADNIVVSENEIALEKLVDGTYKIKIGNGTDSWSNLPYFSVNDSYAELTDRPIINSSNAGTLQTNANETVAGTINLHKIAKTGSYSDLLNKPSIPTLPEQTAILTLMSSAWTNNMQTVSVALDTSKRNFIDIALASLEEWGSCKVLPTAETATGITFKCETVPTHSLTFSVTSMEVQR